MFESFFATTSRLNYSAVGGTRGIMRNHLLLAATADNQAHKCFRRMYPKFMTGSKKYESSYGYIFDADEKTRRVYKFLNEPIDNIVKCRELHMVDFVEPTYKINLGPYGIYMFEYTSDETIELPYDLFHGRLITRKLKWRAGFTGKRDIFFTLPNFWLFAYK